MLKWAQILADVATQLWAYTRFTANHLRAFTNELASVCLNLSQGTIKVFIKRWQKMGFWKLHSLQLENCKLFQWVWKYYRPCSTSYF